MFFFRDKILVHVVVDPLLSNILRPHQREVSLTKTMTNVEKSNDNLYDDCIMRQYFFVGVDIIINNV